MLIDGIVVIDKPSGPTSHDVVAKCRRIFNTRKVGHAGTLDPLATGVLIVGIGRATRLLGFIAGDDKTYLATLRLGMSTTTDDAQGEVLSSTSAAHISKDDILATIRLFRGHIMQRPSSVSAIKVNGERAYAKVRKGEDVVLVEREVTVHDLQVTSIAPVSDQGFVDVDVEVTCSSGTYIRALARDIGAELGVGGHLTSLRRTRIGQFQHMSTLAQLEVDPQVVPLAQALRLAMPTVQVSLDEAQQIRHGIRVPATDPDLPPTFGIVDPQGDAIAVASVHDGLMKTQVVFAHE